jgi:hypothetical protein
MKDLKLEQAAHEAPLSEAEHNRVESAVGIAEVVADAITCVADAVHHLSDVQRAKAKHHQVALHIQG